MATLKQLIESEIGDFFAGFGGPGEPETPEEMQSQLLTRVMPLLAGLEQEPVAQVYQPANIGICAPLGPSVMMLKPLSPGTKLYAAPQLPQPAVVDEHGLLLCPFCGGKPEEDAGGCSEYDGHEHQDYSISCKTCGAEVYCAVGSFEKADVPCSCHHNTRSVCVDKWNRRTAMLQGAEPVTDNTNQQFESLGLIATSDERKMEAPRCGKHPETELQAHPFEMLLSYPPKPSMYCPLCRPSVAEWVEFDKQLRQWKEVK